MRRFTVLALFVCAILCARDKKLPSGEASNEVVSLKATVLDAAELKEIFASDFNNNFAVVEVTLTPRGDKPLEVHLDDFLLRSDQTGEHSGPFQASQIAGSSTLEIHPGEQPGSRGGFGVGLGGIMMGGGGMGPGQAATNTAEMKTSDKKDPMLDILRRKILLEKPTSEAVTGLLFFPLEKEKAKNLNLIYTTAPGKLRVRFK